MSCGKLQILQNPDSVQINTVPNVIDINQAPDSVEIKTCPMNALIIQEVTMIKVCALNPINNFLPFYFEATQGQTVFMLPAVALSCQLCAINGTAQSQAKTPTPDFTINENILTLSEGVDEGDTVFGVIQIS